MSDYDGGLYYSPEKHGLRIFGEIERPPEYDYDKFVVWEDLKDGSLYYAEDSGCSCPSPFEDMSEAQLRANKVVDLDAFKNDVNSWNKSWSGQTKVPSVDASALMHKVQAHVES